MSLDIIQISKYLDISPPFLMIDYVKKIIPGESAYSIKKLNIDNWFFQCHMQKEPIMPGTLQIEAMLQTLVLIIYTMDGHKGKYSYISDIKTKLITKVSPGNKLEIFADLKSYNRGIAKGIATGIINNNTICSGEFTFYSPHDMPIPR